MNKKSAARLGRDRVLLIEAAPEVLEALLCEECGLRPAALDAIALCEWSLSDFLREVVLDSVSRFSA